VDDQPDFFVKVLDFGIAKALGANRTQIGASLTQSGAMLGTPHHMSPEQAEGRQVDGRSDLWSMGVVAFECLTGRMPFDGASLPALLRSICFDPIVVPSEAASVPPGFDAWFAKAVDRDVDQRFQTARALVEGLEPLLVHAEEDWNDTPSAGLTLRQVGVAREPVLRMDAYPGHPPERRVEARVPSSIPAGINGQRDLRHTALIHNASRGGALLVTRHQCHPGQERLADPIWKFEVGVRFAEPLSEALLEEIERRAARSTP
jgi:serine/threonine protein kinase